MWENINKARKAFHSAKRSAEKILPAGWMRAEFRRILAKEANEVWEDGRKKNQNKKDHLESRYKPRKEHGMVEDIPVGDHELGEDNKVVEVLAYEVHLNEDEKEYLKLPNSHTDFVKIDVQKMKTSIQVTAAKLRMGLREEEENGEEETPSQGLEVEEAEPLLQC